MLREALTAQQLDALAPRDVAALFIARRSEGLTDSEQQLLDAWLARDEVNQRALASAELAWRSFDAGGDDEILAAMRAHALAPRQRPLRRWWPAAAAAALGLITLSVVLTRSWGPASPGGPASQASVQYATARGGEVKELQLPDGSRMTLDSGSAAVATFTADRRNLELRKGRALFAVQPDVARRFAVSAAGRSIVAVGTQFEVNLVDDSFTVTLLEGRVDITTLDSGRALVTLAPGQQYVERNGEATVRTIGAAVANVIAWQKGLINFDDQPLAEAAEIMNRYSADQIVIDNEDVAAIRVSGQFRAGDSQRFAATLAEMHHLRLVRHDHRLELLPKK